MLKCNQVNIIIVCHFIWWRVHVCIIYHIVGHSMMFNLCSFTDVCISTSYWSVMYNNNSQQVINSIRNSSDEALALRSRGQALNDTNILSLWNACIWLLFTRFAIIRGHTPKFWIYPYLLNLSTKPIRINLNVKTTKTIFIMNPEEPFFNFLLYWWKKIGTSIIDLLKPQIQHSVNFKLTKSFMCETDKSAVPWHLIFVVDTIITSSAEYSLHII